MAIVDDTPQTRRRFLGAILGGAAAAMLVGAPESADAAKAAERRERRRERRADRRARRKRHREKSDGATWSETGAVVTALFA
jgi:hypothetical protein